jgi:hypothetical protein
MRAMARAARAMAMVTRDKVVEGGMVMAMVKRMAG